jgi:flagellar FliJ protein|uniref:Flagellar FliJ protein n=1 Tax=Desulfobacca acetoxidans TaxID=60893 RepID=A0A7C3Z086_9BACT
MKTSGRFRFPLQTVLKVRILREELARLELAQAQGRLARSRKALAETETYIAGTLGRMKEEAVRNWKASEYQMLFRYLDHLKAARAGWQDQVAQNEAVVKEKMLALEKCHQERQLLENLREKKFVEFRRELTKFLENQSEAMVLARWRPSA